jgi:hypothetical protein
MQQNLNCSGVDLGPNVGSGSESVCQDPDPSIIKQKIVEKP